MPSHKKLANDLLCKSIDWFAYDGNFCILWVNVPFFKEQFSVISHKIFCTILQNKHNFLFLKCLYWIIFVKKEINACVRINTYVFCYKNHDGEYETCPVITPKSIFFEGVTEPHFWRYGAVLPEVDFTFRKFITHNL